MVINLAEKIQLKIYIDKKLNEKFRKFIAVKYKSFARGLLSYEIEMALRNWMSLHTKYKNPTQNDTQVSIIHSPNPPPKVAKAFSEIKEYLKENFDYELFSGMQIPKSHLEKAIMAIRGSDRRTVLKWMKILHKFGLIKPISPATWEIL